jgi:hypothetical protein
MQWWVWGRLGVTAILIWMRIWLWRVGWAASSALSMWALSVTSVHADGVGLLVVRAPGLV